MHDGKLTQNYRITAEAEKAFPDRGCRVLHIAPLIDTKQVAASVELDDGTKVLVITNSMELNEDERLKVLSHKASLYERAAEQMRELIRLLKE